MKKEAEKIISFVFIIGFILFLIMLFLGFFYPSYIHSKISLTFIMGVILIFGLLMVSIENEKMQNFSDKPSLLFIFIVSIVAGLLGFYFLKIYSLLGIAVAVLIGVIVFCSLYLINGD